MLNCHLQVSPSLNLRKQENKNHLCKSLFERVHGHVKIDIGDL